MNKEEIEKAKEKLKKFCDYENNLVLMDNILYEYQDAIETLLQYIDQLEFQLQAKEKVHEYDVNMIDEVKGKSVKLYNKIDKLNKIIDEMAKEINKTTSEKYKIKHICEKGKCKNEECYEDDWTECIKQYFEEKVEGR